MRAVVDTQVWVRAILKPTGVSARVRDALEEGLFTLVSAEPFLEELADVLGRKDVARKHGQAPAVVTSFVESLRSAAELVSLPGEVRVRRDPDDDCFIEAAALGRAELLVTEDEDLRAFEVIDYLSQQGVHVASVLQFLRRLGRVR